MQTAEDLPTEAELREWDWQAELKRQERSALWLARQTNTHYKAVDRYKWGYQQPPLAWLQKVARVLGRGTV